MKATVIVMGAVSQDGVYGKGNSIPWRIKEEMQYFKEQTTGHTVIMGRGTWESLPPKYRPLPNRDNVIISNTPDYKADGAVVSKSIQQAIEAATTEKVFLIGGHDIWYYGMAVADEALITEVKKDFMEKAGDEHMAPELLDPSKKWGFKLVDEKEHPGEIPFTIRHWVKG